MKRTTLTIFGIASLFFMVSCGNSTSTDAEQAQTTEAAVEPVQEAVVFKEEALANLYQQYEVLNTALVASDFDAVKEAAAALSSSTKDLQGRGKEIHLEAEKMVAAADIDAQRLAYSPLSNAVIVWIKESGLTAGNLYVDYCPMALNNEGGYWLSSKKEIENPYFGDQMLTCGEVKETL